MPDEAKSASLKSELSDDKTPSDTHPDTETEGAQDSKPAHLKFIQEHAVLLFDRTQLLHELGDESRMILSLAAMSEDYASKLNRKKPLKSAQKFVSTTYKDKLNARGRAMLAHLIALESEQYKRKDILKSDLSSVEQRVVLSLAAILNIACGLDTSRSQTTRVTRLEVEKDQLWIVIEGPQAQIDGAAAQHQGRLWEKIGYPAVNILEAVDLSASQVVAPGGEEADRLNPNDTLTEAGRKVMHQQFQSVLQFEEGTRLGEDIEALHDMRVATRRLRAAFEVFGQAFESKALKKHLRGLRSTGRALGQVRDLDVFLEKAQKYLATLAPEESHGIDALLIEWQSQREEARLTMLSYLNSIEYQKFKDSFYKFVTTPGAGAIPVPKGIPQPSLVCEMAPALIYERMATVRAFEAIIPESALEQLHALRIEMKKLRYTIEYFRDVLGPEAKGIIQELKLMQDHLGDLNDANVACQLLQEFLDRQPGDDLSEEQKHLHKAVNDYLAYNHSERQRLYQSFPEAWANFNRPEMRKALAQAISVL